MREETEVIKEETSVSGRRMSKKREMKKSLGEIPTHNLFFIFSRESRAAFTHVRANR